jgi:hypothetical protein
VLMATVDITLQPLSGATSAKAVYRCSPKNSDGQVRTKKCQS